MQLGVIALEQFDLAEAETRLSVGTELGKRLGNPRVFLPGFGPLAKTLFALSRADEAQEVLSEGLELSREYRLSDTWGVPLPDAWQAYLDLRTGELEAAFAWVERSGLSQSPQDVPFTRTFAALIAVRILLAKGRARGALDLLERPAVQIGRPVERAVLTALALSASGEDTAALDALERGVDAAATDGHVFTFVDEGEAARSLLARLKAQGRQVAHCTALLAAFPDLDKPEVEAQVEGSEALSERELSVLRLMAGRLSNKEIARELDLSTNTVKWYAKGIFEKLGVHGRLKAASKAQELGFI